MARAVDAAEIWNISYDGKYLPSAKGYTRVRANAASQTRGFSLWPRTTFIAQRRFYGLGIEWTWLPLRANPFFRSLKNGAFGYAARSSIAIKWPRVAADTALVRHIEWPAGENAQGAFAASCAAHGMKKFTILHTIETAGPGGAETVVLELASRLDPSRFRSIALLPREDWLSKNLRERGITTHLVDSKAWHDFKLPRGMARGAAREKST